MRKKNKKKIHLVIPAILIGMEMMFFALLYCAFLYKVNVNKLPKVLFLLALAIVFAVFSTYLIYCYLQFLTDE